ncbi:MAG: YjdF family protein [Oscillospiraceae bacterium]|nr:YjdF family protein [Oscillospiraceae bacterium]
MPISKAKLTVFFEEPFWVGFYERQDDGQYEVSKVTFGAEPKDYEVYEYFLANWYSLRFSPSMEAAVQDERQINPKRRQREAQKAVQTTGIGTKAQQALKLQQEQGKLERKTRSKEQRESEEARQFELKQQKRRGH